MASIDGNMSLDSLERNKTLPVWITAEVVGLSAIAILGYIGNDLIMIITLQKGSRKVPAYVYMCFMAISDNIGLSFSAVSAIIFILGNNSTLNEDSTFCTYLVPVFAWAKSCSAYLLVAMALDRWYSLFYPIKTYIGNRSGSRVRFTRRLSVGIFAFCLALNSYLFIVGESRPQEGKTVEIDCHKLSKITIFRIRIARLVSDTVVPLSVLLVSHLSMICKAPKKSSIGNETI